MEQLKVSVKGVALGDDWGVKKVVSAHWNIQGELETLVVDFMGNENSNDYTAFDKQGDWFVNRKGNLIANVIVKEIKGDCR